MPLYLGHSESNKCKYGIVLILFEGKMEGTSNEELKQLLISYMDYLKTSFEITDAVGYGMGHTMDSNPNAQVIIDFFEKFSENPLCSERLDWQKCIMFFKYIRKRTAGLQLSKSVFKWFSFQKLNIKIYQFPEH